MPGCPPSLPSFFPQLIRSLIPLCFSLFSFLLFQSPSTHFSLSFCPFLFRSFFHTPLSSSYCIPPVLPHPLPFSVFALSPFHPSFSLFLILILVPFLRFSFPVSASHPVCFILCLSPFLNPFFFSLPFTLFYIISLPSLLSLMSFFFPQPFLSFHPFSPSYLSHPPISPSVFLLLSALSPSYPSFSALSVTQRNNWQQCLRHRHTDARQPRHNGDTPKRKTHTERLGDKPLFSSTI